MSGLNSYWIIIAAAILVILSYLFNLFSKATGVSAVLLLLLCGIGTKEFFIYNQINLSIPPVVVEVFGIAGLVMIILEAGLDLKVAKEKVKTVRNAFLSALIILLLSVVACSAFLYYQLNEELLKCIIYALPLSIVSSSIVIPSIDHLTDSKKEFLVYETSFSDVIGILLFNYMVAGNILQGTNIAMFFGSILLSVLVSVVLSVLMLLLLSRIRTKVRFFLVFAILVFLYAGGKMLHLPSLLIILLFGLIVSNWELHLFQRFYQWAAVVRVKEILLLLHSLTAESSFLIRTFFFFIFGLSIDVRLLFNEEVVFTGGVIVLLLLGIRFIYLRFFLKAHILPELFFMPRGLITILLFYSIPGAYQLSKFNLGILFFVVLTTSIIMTLGSITYGKTAIQTVGDEVPLTDQNEL